MTHRQPSVALLALGALALGLAPAVAQNAPPPMFGETIEVRVVNFEVVVTDKQGLPVTGLGAGDFRLVVDGKAHPVSYFTEVRGGDAIAAEAGTVAEIPGMPALAPGEPVGTSYLVFIDEYFSIERDRDRVLGSLIDDLSHLGPDDRMASGAFDGRKLEMLSPWSSSQPALERALKTASDRPTFGLQRTAERRDFDRDRRLLGNRTSPFRSTLETQVAPNEHFYVARLEDQVANMVAGVSAALRGFAAPPGRKVMLLLSGGWPYNPSEYAIGEFARPVFDAARKTGEDLYTPLTDTANQLGYTLYGVDLPGLSSGIADAEVDTPPTFDEQQQPRLREESVQYALERVSKDTGGQALINARREQALARVTADTRSYYWIGFQPQWQGDDKGHRVAIEVTRPGLRVRSRAGYVDFSRQREVSAAVESALLFGNPPNARLLVVELGRPQKAGIGKMRVPVTVSVPMDALTLLPSNGKFVGRFELRAAALDLHGGRSAVPVIPIDISGAAAPVAGQLFSYSTSLELRRQRTDLVLALYDPTSGNLFSAVAQVVP